jgi:hypothetical protein
MATQIFSIHYLLKKEKVNSKGLATIVAKVRINGTKTEI